MKRKNSKQVIQVLCGASSRGWQKHCKYYKADTDEFGERCAYSDCEYCNFTPPLYEPVKPEDVIPGLYWVVDEFGGTSVGLVWQYANERFYRAHSIDTDYGFNNGELKNVTDLFKFYRIPQLNLEVSK